jgi:hypothetical protein
VRLAILTALILILCSPGGLSAQTSLEIAPGDRLRILTRTAEGERQPPIFAEVAAVTGDSLLLHRSGDPAPLGVAIERIERLDRSAGMPSRWRRMAENGGGAAVLAAAYLPILLSRYDDTFSVATTAAIGAALGGAMGMFNGAMSRNERWTSVHLPHQPEALPEALLFPRVTIAGGPGFVSLAERGGSGGQGHISFGLTELWDETHLRGELFYQSSTAKESSTQCIVRAGSPCARRQDQIRSYGGGITMVHGGRRLGSRASVYLPVGIGVFRSEIARSEIPPACSAKPEPCDYAAALEVPPPTRSTEMMAHFGIGVGMTLGPAVMFVESRIQVIGETGPEGSKFAPLSVGVAF